MFCRETMLVFLEGCSLKIGGPNKTVEIDESKFGRQKYHRGHPVKGQWVFGGVERESGETFFVPVKDRTADTIMAIIRDWIEPGTTVISDCWGAYCDLGPRGYTHQTVNHSIQFVDPDKRAHTNTIEGTWHQVKVFLGQYNRGMTINFTSHTTCSRRGARHRAYRLLHNYCISSPTPIDPAAILLELPAPRASHLCISAIRCGPFWLLSYSGYGYVLTFIATYHSSYVPL